MSLDELPKVRKSPLGVRPCAACKSFKAECHAPIGDSSAPMCWLCAHQVVDHEVPLHEAATARCECRPDQIYPAYVMHERKLQMEKAAAVGHRPLHPLLKS